MLLATLLQRRMYGRRENVFVQNDDTVSGIACTYTKQVYSLFLLLFRRVSLGRH